jgi:hypothetical protein
MPDFEKLLQQRLGSWNCPGRSEVVRELVAHLEDRFQELVRQGMAPDHAVLAAIDIVGDWRELRTEIAAARRETMTERARCILLPGALALLIVALAQRLLWPMYAGTPFAYRNWVMVYGMVVAPKLFAGAAGAAASLYAGGSRRQRIWAAELPALAATGLFLVLFTWGIVIEKLSRYGVSWHTMAASGLSFFLFSILIPAGALFAGALPFLVGRPKSQPTEAIGS